jgi:hypothetical protein
MVICFDRCCRTRGVARKNNCKTGVKTNSS